MKLNWAFSSSKLLFFRKIKNTNILRFRHIYYFTIKNNHTKMESTKKWFNPLDKLQNKPIFRTGLHVSNTLSDTKEEFITKDGSKTITWYMCGPTVYDASHLGHARTYVGFDVLRRIMTSYFGYDINLCMNITDIDDKIIERSNKEGVEFTKFAKMWEEDFFKDMKALNVMYPNYITRVSEYIPEIIQFIETLITKGYAYESNGSVYFDIESFQKNNVSFYYYPYLAYLCQT
jgi:cysteinyl-tRNA synthetase